MADEAVTPQQFITGKLRANITDVNATARVAAGHSTSWIYPDKPKLFALISDNDNFPRISVTRMSLGMEKELGMGGTETEDFVHLLINIYTIKDRPLTVKTTTDEEHTYDTGTSVYALTNTPASVISSVSGTVSGEDYDFAATDFQIIDNDSDGRFDSLQWLVTTPDDTTTFSITYTRTLPGELLGEYLALKIHQYLRDNWRTDLIPTLYNYFKVGIKDMDQLDGRIIRIELQVKFNGVNIGD